MTGLRTNARPVSFFYDYLSMKNTFAPLALAALLSTLFLAACRHQERPADVLDAPRMVAFLSDAYLLEGFYAVETQYRYDAMTPEVLRAYDDILDAHGITREQVELSFNYYSEHPELYEAIQDSVLAVIERQSEADTLVKAPAAPSAPIYLPM